MIVGETRLDLEATKRQSGTYPSPEGERFGHVPFVQSPYHGGWPQSRPLRILWSTAYGSSLRQLPEDKSTTSVSSCPTTLPGFKRHGLSATTLLDPGPKTAEPMVPLVSLELSSSVSVVEQTRKWQSRQLSSCRLGRSPLPGPFHGRVTTLPNRYWYPVSMRWMLTPASREGEVRPVLHSS